MVWFKGIVHHAKDGVGVCYRCTLALRAHLMKVVRGQYSTQRRDSAPADQTAAPNGHLFLVALRIPPPVGWHRGTAMDPDKAAVAENPCLRN